MMAKIHSFLDLALAVFLIFLLAGSYLPADKSSWAGDGSVIRNPDFEALVGSWSRTDGGYVIRVGDINPDGKVAAEYFNPHPINIAEANVSMQKNLMKLFIKLQDRGYPGSTYTLYYYVEKDALVGFYYQAVMNQTFEVIFLRKE